MLALPKEREPLQAEADVREFSRQVELALFLDGKLDVSAA
jgi:hypothetical protein